MKKLIVLSLVAAMASFASAAIVLTVGTESGQVGTYVGQDIVSTGSLSVSAVTADSVVSYDIALTIDNGTGGDLALVASGTNFPGAGGTWMFGNTWTGTPDETTARLSGGAWMAVAADTACFDSLVITGTKGTVNLVEVLPDGTTQVLGTFNVVPEPLTMSLLGLGGLFLRRRK